ncbi:PREDICTED: ER membrane protein complex subunit 10-like [Rhagoletis zephyria]|uniref:ER membrane protein complex subunit 10-like n=1 Tax=Rhagoletis zephyria TaxID=28612 RepID=UPI00081181F8|nr:PREDICTED: ER membrane protein complex subunit 10-like [Rhagoletis zephyria]
MTSRCHSYLVHKTTGFEMVWLSKFFYIVALLFHLKSSLCYDNWINIELSHTVDLENLNVFSYRGNVTIANWDIGLAKISQEPLTDHQRSNLRGLAEKHRLYRLKAEVAYANGKRKIFLSASRACNLIGANLNDALSVSVDNSGYVNAVTLLTIASDNW